jgi:hypothetical protein
MTWLYNRNYGTVLQAYALQQVLIKNNISNLVINYKPSFLSKLINLKNRKNIISLIQGRLTIYLSDNAYKNKMNLTRKNKKFLEFIENYIMLTEPIDTLRKIKNLNGSFEAYICGSDQIWTPAIYNPLYYLSFVKNKFKKISYAPSFGMSSIPKNKVNGIAKQLNNFKHISVRESSGANIIKDLINKDVEVVLDPTLLLTQSNWDEIASNITYNQEYLLCYFLSENEEYWKVANALADRYNYKIVILPITAESCKQSHELVDSAGPREFLGLIKNATFILTDSYHGGIFSIINKKDFYVFKRFSDNQITSQNSRIYNLLKLFHIEDRLLNNKDNENINKLNVKIDVNRYVEIHKVLNYQKDKSSTWLINALKS